jgi:hypothetical protein
MNLGTHALGLGNPSNPASNDSFCLGVTGSILVFGFIDLENLVPGICNSVSPAWRMREGTIYNFTDAPLVLSLGLVKEFRFDSL